jgi:ABC-type multidrug transport system permease subunit
MMTPLVAVLSREARIRATNLLFIFWDVVYPLAYLLVFGVAMDRAMQFPAGYGIDNYNAFFLAAVLGMASFGIASNTAWSFFLDRDNGIFYEMLTYPVSRAEYLIGKVLFNIGVALAQTAVTLALAAGLLGVAIRWDLMPLTLAAMTIGTAGWFFFYAIFAIWIRRNDAFNTVTSIFYFVFLFASSMFYPLEPLPDAFRAVAYANPITWQVDVLRYATTGVGQSAALALEAIGFMLFTAVSFAGALWVLRQESS